MTWLSDHWLDILGWGGSALLVYSLLQSRLLRLRVLNLAACLILTVFNWALEVWPMVGMNIVLAAINLWFIVKLVRERHDEAVFEVLQVRGDDEYLRHVLRVHGAEILKFNPEFIHDPSADQDAFVVTRGDETVGVVILTADGDTAHVLLDYVTPRYRDFSPGEFIWRQSGMLSSHGYRRVVTSPAMVSPYYDRVGFHRDGESWVLELPAMITTLIRRVLPVAVVAILLGALVRAQARPPLAADGYFHLRMGHELLGGWSIRNPGHLSPFDTADWLPTQWLAQMGMAALEDRAGFAGVMWVAGVLVIALALACYVCCRITAAPLPAAFATILACSAASPGFSARPQVFSYLLVLVITSAWLATVRDGKPRWWLIPLAWVWAPLHGMWPLSIVIALAVIAGMALDRRFGVRRLGLLALIPLGSALVVLATPLGTGIYGSLLAVGSRAEYFAEWGPTDFTEPYAIALLAMFAVVLLVALKRRPPSWPLVMIIGLAGALSVTSMRMTTVAALMLAPLVAEAFQEFVPTAPRILRREALALAAVFAVCAAVLAPVVDARSDEDIAPSWLDERLDAQPAGTRVLNDWDTGAYFLWRHPQLSLVMHGYGDVFTDAELKRNSDILHVEPGWDEKVDELDADLALVDPDTSLGYALINDLGWTVVEADDDFALLSPPGSSSSSTQ